MYIQNIFLIFEIKWIFIIIKVIIWIFCSSFLLNLTYNKNKQKQWLKKIYIIKIIIEMDKYNKKIMMHNNKKNYIPRI